MFNYQDLQTSTLNIVNGSFGLTVTELFKEFMQLCNYSCIGHWLVSFETTCQVNIGVIFIVPDKHGSMQTGRQGYCDCIRDPR